MQTPSEYPILFSGPMVRAILDGRKTQTRRPVKPQPERLPDASGWTWNDDIWFNEDSLTLSVFDNLIDKAPYGGPSDLMYVCENFCFDRAFDDASPSEMIESGLGRDDVQYQADDFGPLDDVSKGKTRPSLHMPKALSRLWLEVKDVRVERVQEITEDDALAEGVEDTDAGADLMNDTSPTDRFRSLWNDIYEGDGLGWHANPWVWVYTFERIDPADTGA